MKRVFVLVAVLFMGTHAFAQSPLQSPWDFNSSLKLPRYEQWRKLSPDARAKFIESVQAFLLRADAMARSSNTVQNAREAQLIQRLFDLWIETAEAQTKSKSKSKRSVQQQPYCINQGVVKPLSQCDTSLGYKMHDFDTNEILSGLGDASKCPEGEKPCSPFFGFTPEGQMFCSSLNLTRDCAQKSAQAGTITLANTLAACEKGSPGSAKVDCDKLKAFFDQQMDAVEKLCKDAPKRFACGILKEQISFVSNEKSEKDSAISAVGAEKAAEIPAQVNKLVQMIDQTAPCPPETAVPVATQASPSPKAAAQPDSKTKCVSEKFEVGEQPPVFGALYTKLLRGLQKGFVCSQVEMPDKSRLTADREKNALFAQETPTSPPVLIDGLDVRILDLTSAFLLQAPFNISKKDLIPSYFPKQVVVYPEKIAELPTRSWISTNGSRYRYALDDRNSRVLLGIHPAGAEKELMVAISPEGAKVLDDLPSASAPSPSPTVSAAPEKDQTPAKPSEDNTSRAAEDHPE